MQFFATFSITCQVNFCSATFVGDWFTVSGLIFSKTFKSLVEYASWIPDQKHSSKVERVKHFSKFVEVWEAYNFNRWSFWTANSWSEIDLDWWTLSSACVCTVAQFIKLTKRFHTEHPWLLSKNKVSFIVGTMIWVEVSEDTLCFTWKRCNFTFHAGTKIFYRNQQSISWVLRSRYTLYILSCNKASYAWKSWTEASAWSGSNW